MQHRLWRRHPCRWVHLWLRLHLRHRWVRVAHNDIDVCLGLLLQNLQRLVIQSAVLLNADRLLLIPPDLHNPALAHQRVLEGGVGGDKTVVVAVEDVVAIVGCLLRSLDVLGTLRHKLDHVLGVEKDAHQAGHHGAHRIAHLHRYHLAAPILLVTKQVATVILRTLGSDRAQVGVDVAYSVRDLLDNDALELVSVHCLHRLVIGVGLGFNHFGGPFLFLSTSCKASTALGVRTNSSCGNSKLCPRSLKQ